MKKIIILASLLVLGLSCLSFGECDFSNFIKHDVVGARDGIKLYDMYYMPGISSREGDLISFPLLFDYTPEGIAQRLKDTTDFPKNAKVSVISYLVDLSEKQIAHVATRFLDSNCHEILVTKVKEINFVTPPPGSMGEEFIRLGQIIATLRGGIET